MNCVKPVILIFTRYYLPGYRAGGPIRTIANMVEQLVDAFEFRIVTLDRDLGEECSYPGIERDTWVPCGKALVRYVLPQYFGLREVVDIVRTTPHDVIYLNSYFDPHFTQQVLVNRWMGRLCGRPVVIAPRGEFSEGALYLKNRKKSLFIRFAKLLRLYNNVTWQASSEQEAGDVRRALSVGKRTIFPLGGRNRIVVAPDLVTPGSMSGSPVEREVRYRPERPLHACFLSRISPMKNLDFALRVLALVGVPVKFSIYGPIEDAAYWAACQELVSRLPAHVEIVREGAVEPSQVVPVLSQHDLFLFPTRGENFGHVIHEALRAGLPLLISDQTPWQNLEEQGVGWDLPLGNPGAFARRIEQVAGWPDTEYQQWASRALALAIKVGKDPSVVEANRRLFLDAIGHVMPKAGRIVTKRVKNV